LRNPKPHLLSRGLNTESAQKYDPINRHLTQTGVRQRSRRPVVTRHIPIEDCARQSPLSATQRASHLQAIRIASNPQNLGISADSPHQNMLATGLASRI